MRPLILSLTLIASLSATSSHAHAPQPIVSVEQPIDGEFSAGDWALSFLSANAGGVLGGMVGGALGFGLAGECHDDGDNTTFFGPCFMHGTGQAMLVGSIGTIFGGAAGIYAYGEGTGHRGSYWAAAGGWTLGLASALGIGALAAEADEGSAVMVVALFTLPALGGTAAYALSLEEGTPGPMPVGGLLEVNAGELRLGVPNVDVTLDALGDLERIDLTLVGGRF